VNIKIKKYKIFYFLKEHIKTNYKNILKVIIISSIILTYTMLSHYPKMYMYYTYLYPLERSQSSLYISSITLDHTLNYIYKNSEKYNLSDEDLLKIEKLLTNKSIIISLLIEKIGREFGIEDIAFVYKKYVIINNNNLNIYYIEGRLDLIPLLTFKNNIYNINDNDAILSVYMAKNFSETILINGKEYVIVDYGILRIVEEGKSFVIVSDPSLKGTLVAVFIKTAESCNEDRVANIIESVAEELFNVLYDKYNINDKNLVNVISKDISINCMNTIINDTRRLFDKEYGLGSEWGVVLIGGSIVFVIYLVRVALSDVAERLRDMIALLYALGSTDSDIASLLLLGSIIYIVPSVFISLILNYLYLNIILRDIGISIPFWLMIEWFSGLIFTAIFLAVLLAIVVGLFSVRRQSLHRILSGA